MTKTHRANRALMPNARHTLIAQLDEVNDALRRPDLSDDAIHKTRQQLKGARAGVRFLREALGDKDYRRYNRALRDAARPLTHVRDGKVLIDTTLQLFKRPRRNQAVLFRFAELLNGELESHRKELTRERINRIQAVARSVKQAVRALPDRTLETADPLLALVRAYKKARNARTAAERYADNEHLHEWRKQVKYLTNQLQLVRPSKPKRIDKLVKQATQLADRLGDDHDLAVLCDKLKAHRNEFSSASATFDALFARLHAKRAVLQHKARRLGRKLLDDKPKAMRKRLAKYVERA